MHRPGLRLFQLLVLLCAAPSWAQSEADADAGRPESFDAGVKAEAPAAEGDDSSLEALLAEPVLSAASRTAESASEAPATTWSISGTDLARYGIQSVEEAIRFLGHGMTSYEYDSRLNAAFGARGYLSDNLGLHLAVLIDGNQAGGSAKTARGTQGYLLPIELVDHIEIVIGPGSVIYGNSAMLGVVNIVTRAAASLERATATVQASGGLPGDKWAKNASWGEVWSRAAVYGGHTFTLGGDPFALSWHFGIRWDRQQGRSMWKTPGDDDPYLDPAATFVRQDVFNRDFRTRLFARATWGHWTFLSWVGFTRGSGTGPIESGADSATLEGEYALDATWAKEVGSRGNLSLRGYALVYDSRADMEPAPLDPARCQAKVGTNTCSDLLQYVNFRPFFEPVFHWNWRGDGSHVTTLGGQAFVDGAVITSGVASRETAQKQIDEPIIAPLPTVAAYAQHVWRGSFGTLNLGVRGDVGIMGWAVSPRVALSREVWKDGTVKLLFSTGFRTPTITERFLEISGFLTSNPDIRPERVYSAELDLSQRLGAQTLQLAVFGTSWEDIITTRGVRVNGEALSQFANMRAVWSAGANLGWQGTRGPFEWGLSLNYAPGRVRLPADIAQYGDQQLQDLRVRREAVDRYTTRALGAVLAPVGGMPDFYATGHASVSLGERLPRLSLAAHLCSPRPQVEYLNDYMLLDPRNATGPWLPWSVDVRGAVEQAFSSRFTARLVVSGRSLTTVASSPRVGLSSAPLPGGGIGQSTNPVAPLSAMLQLDVRL